MLGGIGHIRPELMLATPSHPTPSACLRSRSMRVGDSVLLGGFTLLVAIVSVVLLAVNFGKPLESRVLQIAFTMGGSTPGLFLLNMFFSFRDERRGLRNQGRLGLALSGLAVLVAIAPLMLAD